MSFGFAVGDFVAVGRLAWDVYKACKSSPDSFKNISMEVLSLHAVLKEAEEIISTGPLSASREARLKTISNGCTCVLDDLQKLVDRYESLGMQAKRTLDRVGWGLEDINELRSRLTSNIVLLNAFLSTSQVTVEKQLEALLREYREGKRESSIASTRTVESLSLDEKQAWRAIRKELEDVGMTVAAFDANKEFIIDWFARAVASGVFHEKAQQDAQGGERLEESFDEKWLKNEQYLASLDCSQEDLTRSVSKDPTLVSTNALSTEMIMSQALRNTSPLSNSETTGDAVSNDHPPEERTKESSTATDTTIGHLSAVKIVRGVSEGAPRDDVSVSFAESATPHRPHVVSSSLSDDVISRNINMSLNSPKFSVKVRGSAVGVSRRETLTKVRISPVDALIALLSRPQNALMTALKEGDFWKVQGILEDDAKARLLSHKFLRNALQAASSYGNEQIVRLLIEKGVDVHAQGGVYGNALQVASICGHEQMVQLLLEKGADVNAQAGHYGYALQIASSFGNQHIVRLLLDNGADVNAKGGFYGNALQAASYYGNEKIVRLLLENGADVHAQSGLYGTALQAASCKGNERTVQLLLEKGADVRAYGGHYGNALQAARASGKQQIVRLLEEKGMEVDAQVIVYGGTW